MPVAREPNRNTRYAGSGGCRRTTEAAKLMAAAGPDIARIGDKHRTRYAVSIGYLRVDPANAVEVLVDLAVPSGDVDVAEARGDLEQAKAALEAWGDKPTNGEWKNANHRLQWAQARLDAASS